jgi:hypothetical protein
MIERNRGMLNDCRRAYLYNRQVVEEAVLLLPKAQRP